MLDTIKCPNCRRHLKLPEEMVGASVCCPACHHVFIASYGEPEPPLLTVLPAPARTRPPVGQAKRPGGTATTADYPDRSNPRRSRSSTRKPAKKRGSAGFVIAILGVIAAVVATCVVVIAGVLLVAQPRAPQFEPIVFPPPPEMPPQERQQWEKELKEAFKDVQAPGDPGNKPMPEQMQALAVDLAPFFKDLGAAMQARDSVRWGACLMCRALPTKWPPRATFLHGFWQIGRRSCGKCKGHSAAPWPTSRLMQWTASDIKHIKRLGAGELVVIVRHRNGEFSGPKLRWWLTSSGGGWKVFDYEDVVSGLRMTAGMGAMLSAPNDAEIGRLQRAVEDLNAAAIAIGFQPQNTELADQKFATLPRSGFLLSSRRSD